MAITHAAVAVAADDPASELSTSEWNDDHVIAAGTIVNADVNAAADIAVSKLDAGVAYQTLRTNAAGTGVEWGYKIYVGTSAPASPATNDIWIDTSA